MTSGYSPPRRWVALHGLCPHQPAQFYRASPVFWRRASAMAQIYQKNSSTSVYFIAHEIRIPPLTPPFQEFSFANHVYCSASSTVVFLLFYFNTGAFWAPKSKLTLYIRLLSQVSSYVLTKRALIAWLWNPIRVSSSGQLRTSVMDFLRFLFSSPFAFLLSFSHGSHIQSANQSVVNLLP